MYLAIDSCLKDQGETDAVVANKGPLKTNIRGTSQYNRRVMTAMIMVLIGSDVKQDRLYDAGNASVRVLKAVLAELEPEGKSRLECALWQIRSKPDAAALTVQVVTLLSHLLRANCATPTPTHNGLQLVSLTSLRRLTPTTSPVKWFCESSWRGCPA